MKKIYPFLFLLSISSIGTAQNPLKYRHTSDPMTIAPRGSGGSGAFYFEGFDDGLGDWTSVTTEGDVDWKWTNEGPGPTPSTYPVPPLNTTTGWAIIDDDFEGTNGIASHAFLISPVIDLSDAPEQLMLEFDQYFQEFQNDSTFVGISTDGGVTWNEIEFNQGVGRDNRPNPERKIMNITDWVANDPSSVQIRFRYRSVWDYGWQVDNVGIYELPPYELIVNYGYISHTGGGEEYGRIPTAQFGDQLYFGAELFNAGQLPLTDLQVQVTGLDVNDVQIFSEILDWADLAAWDTVLVEGVVSLPDLAQGLYRVMFTASYAENDDDHDPSNNMAQRNFEMNDDVYSLDGLGIHPEGTEMTASTGTQSFADAADELFLMNYYLIRESTTIYGLEFDIHPDSEPGGYVYASLLDSTDVINDIVSNSYGESAIHDITAEDIAAGKVTLAFDPPVDVGPGAYYAATVLNSIDGSAHFRVIDDQTVPQPDVASVIHITNDATYSNGNAWTIRLLLDPLVSVHELEPLAGLSVLPNPTNGITTIRTGTDEVFDLRIIDVVGSLVHTSRISGTGTVDLAAHAPGVYLLEVSNDRHRSTIRLVKE